MYQTNTARCMYHKLRHSVTEICKLLAFKNYINEFWQSTFKKSKKIVNDYHNYLYYLNGQVFRKDTSSILVVS